MKTARVHLSFPSTYDRADVLMSAGCSTFASAALILVMPRVGTVMLEVLLGLFLIGCALVARTRLRRKVQPEEAGTGSSKSGRRWLDRYDAVMIFAVILVQSSLDRTLQHLGWSEGSRRIFPLVLLGIAILLKPRLVQLAGRHKKSQQIIAAGPASESAAEEPWWKSQIHAGAADQHNDEKGSS
jgi:4-amino-4-deoxy-L-arabinose transferase-like glycosyltransferase